MRPSPTPRAWSRGEELANCVSHVLGLVASLVAGPYLVSSALNRGDSVLVAGVIVFILTAAALYFASACHHALPEGGMKAHFERLDHAAIFLLIAGTYTPVGLSLLRGGWGWSILALIWAIALIGAVLRLTGRLTCPRVSIALYVSLGWLMLTAKPFWANVLQPGVFLLLAGGVAYTGGLLFYIARRLRYHHLLWHLSVIAGTACHYAAILWLVTSFPGAE